MPDYRCWDEDEQDEEGAYLVDGAFDDETAAALFAKRYDERSGEGWQEERMVHVRCVGTGELTVVKVSASLSVDYSGDRV